MQSRIRDSKWILGLALTVCLALLGVVTLRQLEVRKIAQLNALYPAACGGDSAGFWNLSQRNSTEAIRLLQKLAKTNSCSPDVRVGAAQELATKGYLFRDNPQFLLHLDQPYDLRHMIGQEFLAHGCNHACVAIALESFHSLWQGQPTLEDTLETETEQRLNGAQVSETLYGGNIQSARRHVSDLRELSRRDNIKLLATDPCEARRMLRVSYASDQAFSQFAEHEIPLCGPFAAAADVTAPCNSGTLTTQSIYLEHIGDEDKPVYPIVIAPTRPSEHEIRCALVRSWYFMDVQDFVFVVRTEDFDHVAKLLQQAKRSPKGTESAREFRCVLVPEHGTPESGVFDLQQSTEFFTALVAYSDRRLPELHEQLTSTLLYPWW